MSHASLAEAVEHWTDDRPDPARWLATPGIEHARTRVLAALARGERSIVVCGPSGHGKTLLLRSLAAQPPRGYEPLFVPFLDAEPFEVELWLLACGAGRARTDPGSDPETALLRFLRGSARRGHRPLLLLDEGQATPPDTARRLLDLLARSGTDPAMVVASLDGRRLPDAFTSPEPIGLDTPWSVREVSDWLRRVAASVGVSERALLERVDVDAVVRSTCGNPRLLQARIATWLEPELCAIAAAREPQAPRVQRTPAPAPCLHAHDPAAIAAVETGIEVEPSRSAPMPRRADAARAPLAGFAAQWALAFGWRGLESLALGARGRAALALGARGLAALARVRPIGPGAIAATVLAMGVVLLVADRPTLAPIAAHPPRAHIAWPSRAFTTPDATPAPAAVALAGREGVVAGRSIAPVTASAHPTDAPSIAFHVNAVPWAHVEVDGRAVGTTPLTLALAPGPHHFRVEMMDGRSIERVVEVSPEHDRVGFR
jgi:hypothetical protein